MLEELMTNTFIEIGEKNDEYLLKSIDYDNNIQTNLLSNILFDENNIKKIKSSNKIVNFQNAEYFKEKIKNINIDEIAKEFKKIHDDYNEVMTILEERIKKFKKKIDKQIELTKKIIDIYNLAIKSDKITYPLIINTKNILQFNPIIKNEFFSDEYQFNFDYNLLKPFSIDELIDEEITIRKIQKNIKIKISQKNEKDKNSLLFLKEMNKLICYNKNKIISFNLLNFKKENEVKLNDELVSLNLTNDNNIYAGFANSIKKLKLENNKIIIENYLDNINLYKPGKIIKYKNSIAWTNHNFIGFDSENYYNIIEQLNIEWNSWSGYSKSMLLDLIEYKNDNIIYLFSLEYFDHHGQGGFSVNLGSYKKDLSKGERIELEDSDDELYRGNNSWYLKNNYKLLNNERNKIIVITVKNVFIINISKWEIMKTVSLVQNNINNSYSLNDKCFLFLFNNDPCYHKYEEILVTEDEKKNIIFYKIGENNEKKLYESKLEIEDNCIKLYYINMNNKNYIITYNLFEEITFYEIINMRNNKKINIKI